MTMVELKPKIVFAGDRDIAVNILDFLTNQDVEISALLLPDKSTATHDRELISLSSHLSQERILRGEQFREDKGIHLLKDINPDYILAIHFQFIIPIEVLDIPNHGVVNLHPAYLPYNRGWHTPSWAIWEQTPYGATLHFMDDKIDAGDIIARQKVTKSPGDTADSLYAKAKKAEFELFKQTWPELSSFDYTKDKQSESQATTHRKSDIEEIREIELDEQFKAETIIRKLRALTTNDVNEAAFFEQDGDRYLVQVDITSVESEN